MRIPSISSFTIYQQYVKQPTSRKQSFGYPPVYLNYLADCESMDNVFRLSFGIPSLKSFFLKTILVKMVSIKTLRCSVTFS